MIANAPVHLQHRGLVSLALVRQLLSSTIETESHWIKDLSDREFAAEFTRIAHAKSFMLRWQADPDFRAQVSTDPAQAVARYNLQVDPEEIKPFWAPEFLEPLRASGKLPILAQRCQDFIQASEERICTDRIDTSHNRQYQAWRSRQIERLSGQVSQFIAQGVMHAPLSFELSKGCSVGCWFCSVSAPTLNDIFLYTPENARLWQDILQLLKNVLGTAAASGFCYWATDPLDNPHYEQFLCDFHAILGVFPQTTTAQSLKDIARTKSLLKLALEKGGKLNRFSILSLKMFDRVSAAFTPEELAFVGLVLQNQEAGMVKANAGRMRDRNEHQAAKSNTAVDTSLPTTNACVSGFLFNLVDRNVKLISPCPASELWPHGYRVYAEGTFTTVAELTDFLDRAIETHMPLTLRSSDLLRFRSDLKYEEFEDGFHVSTRFLTLKFRNEAYLKQLGQMILQGDKTVAQITSLFNILGVNEVTTLAALNLMFAKGIFED
ncbi:MAG: radical SAM family RiPP maturation amino acid epimerase [Chamaesiphon sp.]|nr:radical SAM family RiPP maturation amino acid epimerase [Chamaesiphon sp.]